MNLIEVATLTEIANRESTEAKKMQCYTNEDHVTEVKNKLAHLEYFNDEETDAECITCLSKDNPNIFNLTFIGTNSKRDWLADLDFYPIPLHVDESKTEVCLKNHVHEKFKVHRGFYNQFLALWTSNLEKKVHKFFEENNHHSCKPKKQTLIISGHSLGGGLAIIAAIYVHQMVKQHRFRNVEIKVLTIGAPRVVNDEMAMWYNTHLAKNTFRVVNHYDSIPNLPFDGPLFKFCHVQSTLLYFKNKGLLNKEPYRTICDRMIAVKGGFKTHGIHTYIGLLKSFDLLKKIII